MTIAEIEAETDRIAITEFYSTAAIYSLRPCSEEIARWTAANGSDPRPVRLVEYRERKEPRQLGYDEGEDDDEIPM